MIGSLKRQYVFLTPARAGVLSWRAWLVNCCGGEVIGETHDWKLPAEYVHCRPFLPVRNPYDRCISLWWYSCADPSRETKCSLYGCSFVSYMYCLLWFRDHLNKRQNSPQAYMNLSMYADKLLEQTGSKPEIVHLESYEADLLSTGGFSPQEISGYRIRKSSNTRPLVPANKFLSGMEEELVWQYCQEDFFRFGYKRLPRIAGVMRCW